MEQYGGEEYVLRQEVLQNLLQEDHVCPTVQRTEQKVQFNELFFENACSNP